MVLVETRSKDPEDREVGLRLRQPGGVCTKDGGENVRINCRLPLQEQRL